MIKHFTGKREIRGQLGYFIQKWLVSHYFQNCRNYESPDSEHTGHLTGFLFSKAIICKIWKHLPRDTDSASHIN